MSTRIWELPTEHLTGITIEGEYDDYFGDGGTSL